MPQTLALFLAQAQGGSFFDSTEATVVLGIALLSGLFMAWSIGANDVANAMGTSVGSGALTLKRAIIVAAALEFAGAFLVGSHVSGTIREGILPIGALQAIPDGAQLYVFGMIGALLAAACWLLLATYFGLPVSTTHSIVGAVLGFGLVIFWGQWELIAWDTVGAIIASWVVSPLAAGLCSSMIFLTIRSMILYQRDMVAAAKRMAPFLVGIVVLTISLVTLYKGLKPLGLHKVSFLQALFGALPLAVLAGIASLPILNRVKSPVPAQGDLAAAQNPLVVEELEKLGHRLAKLATVARGPVEEEIQTLGRRIRELHREVEVSNGGAPGEWGTAEMRVTEKIFGFLQVLSACTVAFAHGANDVANAVGPLGGVITVLQTSEVAEMTGLSTAWGLVVLALGGLGIVVGLATWGWRVIETVGRRITELTPTRGFSAEFGAALTILIASRVGLPISTTHTLVGAVLGVGFARGIGALNLRVVRDIVISWLVTVPAGAVLAVLFYFVLRAVF